jgi:GDP/UDP-N,N'-diacetylbacillosamine 2-epimerase (hydrolysing)
MEGIRTSTQLYLQVIATGMHLSPEFGLTYQEIESDGFHIERKVEMLLSADTPSSISKSMGLAMVGFADAYEQLHPDLLLVLGDRYEMLAAATTAMIARIPIAHLHGGETTEGAFDEAIRHSITKMAHLHFVAAEEYRQRVVQLGEHPDRVFQVGGLGIDNILRLSMLDRQELELALDFQFGRRNLLITFHPVTLEQNTSAQQMQELLEALAAQQDTNLIFTMPNADSDGRILFKMIENFVSKYPEKSKAFTSLGQLRYLSCLRYVDAVIGNSSSGLAEVPSFKIGTINIGDRQRGRLKASSVIDCDPDRESIQQAFERLYSPVFKEQLASTRSPYGEGGASESIVKILAEFPLEDLIKKKFYNLQ